MDRRAEILMAERAKRGAMAERIAVNYPWSAADILPLTRLTDDEQKIRQTLDQLLEAGHGISLALYLLKMP